MKIYYFLNSVNKDNYNYLINKLELLKRWYSCKNIIQKYFYKIWDWNNNIWRINFGFFIDVFSFIENMKEKYNIEYKEILEKIEFINVNRNFYIFNDNIYIENSWNNFYTKINLNKKTYFVTSRDSWLNPFFILLYKLWEINKKLYVIRPNKREWWIYNDDKISNTSKLYQKREKLIWDVIVPLLYKRDNNSLYNFFDSVKTHLWNFVVIKKNSSQYWDWVKMLDLNNYKNDKIINFLRTNYINNWFESIYSIFITPLYKIKKEYRVYYIFNQKTKKTKIYAIKNRINENIWDIFWIKNYTINEDVKVTWKCMLKKTFNKNEKLVWFMSKISKNLWYDKWVIEFFENEKWELIYSELNSLWALLLFKEDENNMFEYYKKIWKIFI